MKNDKKKTIVADVDRYRVTEPLFECVRIVLSHRTERYSPAYIQGISGAAFRIAGICPCAPTCSCMMDTVDLIALLGYESTLLQIYDEQIHDDQILDEGIDPAERLQEILTILKSEIDGGRPALLWHAFTFCEWDVVCGYDTDKHQLFGRGSYAGLDEGKYASADDTRALTAQARMPYGAILIGDKTSTFDAGKAELAALTEAVGHAESKQNKESCSDGNWAMLEGLLCYDRWVEDYRSNPSKRPDLGDSYCLGVYSSTHQAAGQFLHELALKYPKAEGNLNRAAEQFTAEAGSLGTCYEMICPGGENAMEWNPERNEEVTNLLSQARERYACGIEEIETALLLIDR